MINRIKLLVLAGTAFVGSLTVAPLAAQGTGQEPIPPAYRPPPGMCRIWLDGVPPSKQPAPTDCPTAVKNKPANGRVIFGDPVDDKGGDKKDPFLKKFGGKGKRPGFDTRRWP